MPRRNLYIGDRDTSLWEAADRLARRRRVSVSRLVTEALADYLPRAAAEPSPDDRWAHIAADVDAA